VARALPLRLTLAEWRRLLRWFLLGQSAAVIAQEARLERKRVLRALLLVRQGMVRDVSAVCSGTVEIDETYLGGAWRNKRRGDRAQGTKRGRGTTKQAVFGILCRGGQVWAEVVPNVEARTLLPLLHQRVTAGSVVCSDTFNSYTGIAAGGYVHRLVDHSQACSDRHGSHVNGLEGFWGYLKRRLAAKGGVRRERLPLYLAEYVWRYNHRRLSAPEQVRILLKLLQS
jgi:transposase